MTRKQIRLHTLKTTLFTLRRALMRVLNCRRPRQEYQHKLDYWNNAVYRERVRQVCCGRVERFFALGPACRPIIKPIDILLPVYNGYEFLRPCLDSLLKYTDLPFHIYIADDKSPDERVLPLLREYQAAHPDKITLIENKQNQGWLKNINMLITQTKNDFVLLNSDTEVTENWASRLFYPIFNDSSVAAAGPWSNASSMQSIGFRAREGSIRLSPNYINRLASAFTAEALYSMPYLTGFCLAISRESVHSIGILDPIYGNGYYEETDWLERAHSNGYKIAFVLRCFIYHKGTSSFSSEQKKKLVNKNAKIFHTRYPQHAQMFKRSQFNPEYMAAHFLLLAQYMRAVHPALALQPAAGRPNASAAFTWKKDKDSFLYELFDNNQYEALCSTTPPEEMQRLTRPAKEPPAR